MIKEFNIYEKELTDLKNDKILISTINAHSYNVSQQDGVFKEALQKSDILIPDGISVVWAIKWLTGKRISKIAGADLFYYEMKKLQTTAGKVFFLGSTEQTLMKIKKRVSIDYPRVHVETYSPPYKSEFSDEDSILMVQAVNEFKPDVLFIGLTAPKQEKWAYKHYKKLNTGHIGCIGAVFDFYAGNIERAPRWMIELGFEWLYRLANEPKRMWRRYIIGNMKFIYFTCIEKIFNR